MEHGTFFAALLPGEESTCPHYTQERAVYMGTKNQELTTQIQEWIKPHGTQRQWESYKRANRSEPVSTVRTDATPANTGLRLIVTVSLRCAD